MGLRAHLGTVLSLRRMAFGLCSFGAWLLTVQVNLHNMDIHLFFLCLKRKVLAGVITKQEFDKINFLVLRFRQALLPLIILKMQVFAEEAACLRVALSSGKNQGFQFKTHPNIDKGLYNSQNLLGLKDPESPFPTSTQLGILRWAQAAHNNEHHHHH